MNIIPRPAAKSSGHVHAADEGLAFLKHRTWTVVRAEVRVLPHQFLIVGFLYYCDFAPCHNSIPLANKICTHKPHPITVGFVRIVLRVYYYLDTIVNNELSLFPQVYCPSL